MARRGSASFSLAITISISIVIGTAAIIAILNMFQPVLDPRIRIVAEQFTPGPCQTDFTFGFVTGHHEQIITNLTLSNTGPTSGRATVIFTSDGKEASRKDFFVGSGQNATVGSQFSVDGCDGHIYSAYVDGVQRASA